MVINSYSSRFYSILEPHIEDLVVNECVCSSSSKKEVSMDKKNSSLKLKVVGALKVSPIVLVFVLSIFSLELDYVHTRDSSRADSIPSSHLVLFFVPDT